MDERVGQIFVNNLLYGDENFDRLLLYTMQPAVLCGSITEPQFKQLDYNVYVRAPGMADNPLVLWGPVQNENCREFFKSLEGIRKLQPEFSANSQYFADYDGPLFKSPELGNFQLLESFPGFNAASQLPVEISKILGQSKSFIGAYPPIQEK